MTEDKNDAALRRFQTARTIAAFKDRAAAEPPCTECDEDPVTAAAEGDVPLYGDMVLYDVPTGDGRRFLQDGFSWDLELEGIPIIWDRDDGDHTGMILGKIDSAENVPGSVFGVGRLFASVDPVVQAAVERVKELIAENALGWSIRFDNEVGELRIRNPQIEERDGETVVRLTSEDEMLDISSARIRHIALVDTPAFPGARPILGSPPALAIAAAAHVYPAAHFAPWESRDPVPLQVDADGRIWGHAAGDGCFRNGGGACQRYQRDPDPQMRNFHTGTVTLDNGEVIRTGVLTAAGLHASTSLDLSGQRHHHENSTTVYAKVRAFEDRKGRLCLTGSLVPGLEPTFTAQVAGLPVSIEKWPVAGVHGLTLVGAHAVPVPAWPVGV